jgi:hypothetical protein
MLECGCCRQDSRSLHCVYCCVWRLGRLVSRKWRRRPFLDNCVVSSTQMACTRSQRVLRFVCLIFFVSRRLLVG